MTRFFLALCALLLVSACQKDDGGVGIAEVYAFATNAQNGAVFATIENKSGEADRLTGATSDVAASVEIHENAMDGGTMKMRKVDGVDIPAHGEAVLDPKGYHIMLLGLKQPLAQGETFDLTLHFEKAGDMTFPVPISAPGKKPQADMNDMDHDHMDMDHGQMN